MASPTQKPVQFGRYFLDRKLAEGGMAEVFLARRSGVGDFSKEVVLKRILPSLSTDASFVQMFLNEARLAARLSHTNIVQVFEAGEVDGQYYIEMEYIEGVDLRVFYDEAERTGRPMAPGLACRIIADLLGGLHYAHTRSDESGNALGIVHRDVSPQNVLVARSGTVKIVDFGIAKATRASAQQTQAGQVKGKISYLSPEQAMGRSLDARSDVFACGILLWELVTGARLFSRPNDMASILAITEDDIPMPRAIRPELPAALDQLMRQALARPLSDRFPSAAAMQSELEALIRSQGWPGDRRSLERHMQARLGAQTPPIGVPARSAEQVTGAGRGSDYADGPTELASPLDQARVPGPRVSAPMVATHSEASTLSMDAQHPPIDEPPLAPPSPTPGRPRTPSGMRQLPPTIDPTSHRPRTPSGMRSMPSTPGPASYGPPSGTFDGPTAPSHEPNTGRRVLVVATAAALVSVAAFFALDLMPGLGGAAAPARLLIEVTEPAIVEIDGRSTVIDRQGELEIRAGQQIVVNATTSRPSGPQSTRAITLPPAHAKERIPLKISFP